MKLGSYKLLEIDQPKGAVCFKRLEDVSRQPSASTKLEDCPVKRKHPRRHQKESETLSAILHIIILIDRVRIFAYRLHTYMHLPTSIPFGYALAFDLLRIDQGSPKAFP